MKSYWNYDAKERSLMTDDDVRKLLDFELMEQGVAKVVAPDLVVVPDEVQVARTLLFQIQYAGKYGRNNSPLLFKTADDARLVSSLLVGEVDTDYESGAEYARPLMDRNVVSVDIISAEEHARVSAVLKERKQAIDANKKAETQFAKDSKTQQSVLDKVWEDWHEQRAERSKFQRIRDTRAEYLRMCDGNAEIAEKFLAKLFPEEEIKLADEWFETPTA